MIVLIVGFAAFSIALGGFLIYLGKPWVSVPVLTICLGIVWYGGVETLGRNKPIAWEWRDIGETEVLSYKLDEPNAIYVWLDGDEPTGYVLPWSQEVAKILKGQAEAAQKQGAPLMFDERRLKSQEDREPLFYPKPQPEYPPKP